MNIHKYRKEIVFFMDLFIIVVVSCALFYKLPESSGTGDHNFRTLFPNLILFLICWAAAQIFFKTYDSLWRYAQSKEYLMMFLGGVSGFLLSILLDFLLLESRISTVFTLLVYAISFLIMLLMRMCYRQYRKLNKNKFNMIKMNRKLTELVIIGAGSAGVKLLEELESNPNSGFHTKFFIDDSIEKIGKRIHDIEVKGPITNLEKLLVNSQVNEIVITTTTLPAEKRKMILDICSSLNCHVRILPDTLSLLEGNEQNPLWNSVRDIKLEELLGREQVILNNEDINDFLHNKVVMVTGGGGSIGSELCRQIMKVNIKKLIIVDIYENNAYDIQQELRQIYGNQVPVKIEIATVRDKEKVNQLMERHRPNIVFHAAAHKHVPMMEECPEEAILNNIFGTYHMVQAADRYGVDKFVLISTDKAVNPTNIMGASKRFCEMILQSMKGVSKTEFVAVRFGNVLGSNGSVIPLFQKQIAQGGPVTITDKRIVRYFMTISEAAQLVLQAGAMANSSEVYVLDMGEPVKILELAENLIRLSGHIPYTEIPIIETGLRPGEKLYEELLMNSEELIATKNHKIYIEHQNNISEREIKKKLKVLKKALKTKSYSRIKIAMKQVVPTYKDPEEVNSVADS